MQYELGREPRNIQMRQRQPGVLNAIEKMTLDLNLNLKVDQMKKS
jgi:hypothetical protein